MWGESQILRSGIADGGILEGEWPLRIVTDERLSVAARLRRICLVFLVLPLVLILVGWREGNLILPGAAIGLLEDWNILTMFGAFPAAVLLLHFAVRRFDEFVKQLVELIDESDARQKKETVAQIQSLYADIVAGTGHWRWLRILCISTGIGFVFYNAYNRYFWSADVYSSGFWTSSDYPISFWVTNIYTLIVWGYIAPIGAFKLFCLLMSIAQIVRKIGNTLKLRLIVLSADRSGGLKALGNVALALSYVMLPFQLNFLVYYYWIPKVNVPFMIGTSIILAASPVLFLLPVWWTHRAMTRVRDAVVEKISNAYNRRLQEILESDSEASRPRFERALVEMKNLDEVFNALLRIHVWPVDLSVLWRFSAVIAAPVLTVSLQYLLKIK